MSEIIPLKTGTDEHARAETDRKRRLFAWADLVLQQLGFADRVAQADSVDELRKVAFDADTIQVALAIRDALHPATGKREEYFVGLSDPGLKRLLKTRFVELKKEREQALRGGASGRRATRDWSDDLVLDDAGGVRPLLANLILFLREHPKWKGVLAYDEFNAHVVIRKRLPWGDETLDATWTDHHESLTRTWFQREDIAAQHGDVGRAVQAAARANVFHPVRDFFDALVWDGTTRLDTWLPTYLHADDSEYARAVGPRFLISAVARIYEPGCKVDHVLVLEGPQGKQKSEALRTLAIQDGWFTDRLSHVGSKDAAQELAGVLLVEIAELDALTKASSSAIKAFLTRRRDRFRPPYGRHPISLPRQCVFAGTINPLAGGYLKDPTGARRIWPVACHGVIDREALERDRDQLWAEAVTRFKAGAKWWLETPKLEALATAEQALRFKEDAWKGTISKWIGERQDASIAEVLERALKIAPREQTHSAEIRVAAILTELGFTKYRARKDGKRENRYQRQGEPDDR
jgi:putative DNA primase/helicase